MRVLRTRWFALVACGLLPVCLGGMGGCSSRPADGDVVEQPEIDAKQKTDVRDQYQKQRLERKKKAATTGKGARGRRPNG